MIYIETGSTDAAYNLAFEQYVLENCTEGEFLILWQNEPTVVIGQNQNASEEINRDFADEHGIKVVRRMTGGGPTMAYISATLMPCLDAFDPKNA